MLSAHCSNVGSAPGVDRIGRSRARLVEEDQSTERCHRLDPPLKGRQLRQVLAAGEPVRDEHDVARTFARRAIGDAQVPVHRIARLREHCGSVSRGAGRVSANAFSVSAGRLGCRRLVSRHGSHLAVGVGSVRSEVLVGDLRDHVPHAAAGLPRFVVCRCRFRGVRPLRRGGRRHRCRRAGAGVRGGSSRRGRGPPCGAVGGRPRGRSGEGTGRHLHLGSGGGCPSRWWAALFGPPCCWSLSVRSPGRRGSRLVQYGILGAAFGAAVQLIGVHSFVEAAMRPARVAIAGDTGIGDALPRSRPTFAAWSNVSMLAVAFVVRRRGRDAGGRVRSGQ